MAGLLQPSASDSSGASASLLDSNALATFRNSTFFNVLGRIDEESSSRASHSNMTSQDSSPRSFKSSDGSESADRLNPMPPEFFESNNCAGKKGISSAEIGSSDIVDRNVPVVTTIMTRSIENPEMNNVDSIERRQDRSSPILGKSSFQALSPNISFSSRTSHSPGLTQSQHHHLWQEGDSEPQDVECEEQLKRENTILQRECEELESILLQMKTEGNIFQVKTALKLKNYRAKIERATLAKQNLQTQCRELEDRIWSLRDETQTRQEEIWDADQRQEKN